MMNRPTKLVLTRARLVLMSFVIAIVALVTGLALAQEANPGNPPPRGPRRGPGGRALPTLTAAPNRGDAPQNGPQNGAQSPHGGGPTGAVDPHAADPHAGGDHRADDHAGGPAAGPESGEHGEHGETGEHAEHAAGGHHGPEPINWTDIWDKRRPAILALVINFGVLLTLYYMLGKKPITEALKQRRVTIGKEIEEAQALLDEAKERGKKYQSELKTVDVDAAAAKAALIAAGKGEVERLLLEAQERAERMRRDADRLVDQERKQLHQDLLAETVELAMKEASRLLEKSVTADDHARLAQDLLAELARRPAAKPATSVRPPSGSTGGAT